MAYFPHAFKKVFVGSAFVTTGKTESLTQGQFGFFDTKTWTAITTGNADIGVNPRAVLAVGAHHDVDKVGTHGGYKESIKSQVIDPRYIHRFWKVKGRNAQNQIVQVGWDGSDDATSPQFRCGQTYSLRIDIKGSPALRFVGHDLYHTFSYFTGCCTSTDIDVIELVDPIVVLLEFAKQINEDPIFSHFVSADVITTDGGDGGSAPDVVDPDTYEPLTDAGDIEIAIGSLRLTVAYVDTQFNYCSFDPRDHFEVEPLIISSAQLVDESGDPCKTVKQLTFTETQSPRTADGTGGQVLRDLIKSDAYRQEPYHTDPRRRQAENIYAETIISSSSIYDTYYILHSVPRRSNPSGVYDNDLYLIQLNVPENTSMTTFETWVNNYADSAATGVAIEDLSGESDES